MRLLDSDILIDVQRGFQPALEWFAALTERPCVSSLVVMELIQDAPDKRKIDAALKIVRQLTVVYASESDQARALDDYKTLHLSTGLGLLDALIAATAIGLSASLCTFNVKHYRHVSGLTLEQPYSRTP